ncbi:hypothetical protein L218DRAFT_1007898 [Marasmius fiardii PR-910]|nr:hypothetical protein L218DRAFT_1007898 [Marasmius fiardii PR-910]
MLDLKSDLFGVSIVFRILAVTFYRPECQDESRKDKSGHKGNSGGAPPPPPPPGGNGPPDSDDDPDHTDSDEDIHPRSVSNSVRRESHTPKPATFGQTRYTSVDHTFNKQETFNYDPRPQSHREILRAAFQQFEDLIIYQLLGTTASEPAAANLRKNLLQSIPNPEFYYGDNNDYVKYDEWVRSLVHWLALAGLVGPATRWSDSKNDWVLTSIDIQRTNVIGTLVKGDAAIWFADCVEAIPERFNRDNPYRGQMTFMEVISGLYRRFIHDASLTHVAEKLKDVRYTVSGSVKGVFSAMIRYAKCMPSPPDPYSFKQQLLLKLPESMADDMTSIHYVTAESSLVNEIIQAALACKRGFNAKKYYLRLKEENNRAQLAIL